MFWRAGMREGGKPLPLPLQYLIFMVLRPCYLNLVMMSSLASKCQDFKVKMPFFQPFYVMKSKTSKFQESLESNIEMLVRVAPLTLSFPTSETQAFYIINMPKCINICNTCTLIIVSLVHNLKIHCKVALNEVQTHCASESGPIALSIFPQ